MHWNGNFALRDAVRPFRSFELERKGLKPRQAWSNPTACLPTRLYDIIVERGREKLNIKSANMGENNGKRKRNGS